MCVMLLCILHCDNNKKSGGGGGNHDVCYVVMYTSL